MKKLLLVAYDFPPLNSMAAQRFPGMLQALEANGWQPWVLTTESQGPLTVHLPAEQIIRCGVNHQVGLSASSESEFVHRYRGFSGLARTYHALGLTLRSFDGSLFTWARAVNRSIDGLLPRLPSIDLVMGSYSPAASLWLARRLSRLYEVPWIADFRDLGALQTDSRWWAASGWIDRFIERRLIRSAAAVTTCGLDYTERLKAVYNHPTMCVYNGFDAITGIDSVLPKKGDRSPRLTLHYSGRIRPRQIAAFHRLLEAVRGTPFRIVVRSVGPTEGDGIIAAQARTLGVIGQLDIKNPLPHHEIQAEANRSTANLVLETVSSAEDWTRGHLSGKLFQLLPLRPPILYVGRSDAEAGTILQRSGKGVLCTTVEQLREALIRLEAGGEWTGDEHVIQEYQKRRQGERLLQLLNFVTESKAKNRPGHRGLDEKVGGLPWA